jgi:biotin carboxyl carrier protein
MKPTAKGAPRSSTENSHESSLHSTFGGSMSSSSASPSSGASAQRSLKSADHYIAAINGVDQQILAVRSKNGIWYQFEGETHFVEALLQAGRLRGRAVKVANPGQILAPMPGKVIKVLKKQGESVQVDDVIVVMEAMKMEYTIRASALGIVEETLIAEGAQVELGALLVKITVAKEDISK